ncbi:MAG: response regulator [Anaerolineales bacterium]|nr:response regulator [Anaerolineales bacterium]
MAEKILIIDDDVDTLKLVGLMLERQGYEIAVASSGTLGVEKAASEMPDLILLDIMMPDMDGYEVTRHLRSDPTLEHIPIIMFTAKTMVDDKVAGFESGVDDYLTKPTHPAELTAHIKAVLSRTIQTIAPQAEKAQIMGFLGSRGGIGTSTLALNVSIVLKQDNEEVIFAELNPGHGTVALELSIPNTTGLSNLLTRSLNDIHLRSVETEIVHHKSGIRMLLSSHFPGEVELDQAIPQMEAIVENLSSLCTTLILDFGSSLKPYVKSLLKLCDRLILVVEPVFPSNIIGRAFLEELVNDGINKKKICLALINRVRSTLQIPWRQVETDMGLELAGIVSPAPDIALQASQSSTPLVVAHPDSLVSDQIRKLSKYLTLHLQRTRD